MTYSYLHVRKGILENVQESIHLCKRNTGKINQKSQRLVTNRYRLERRGNRNWEAEIGGVTLLWVYLFLRNSDF